MIEKGKKYRISFDYKKGSNNTKTYSTIFFKCLDKNKKVINERDVKELTNPCEVEKIDEKRMKFYISNIEKWEIGEKKCIAFNLTNEIDTTTQVLLTDIKIISIEYDDSNNLHSIEIDRIIPDNVSIGNFVALHSNNNYFCGRRSLTPTDEYQTIKLEAKDFSKGFEISTSSKFPVCTEYVQIYIRSHPNGNSDEITLYKNIKFEEVFD